MKYLSRSAVIAASGCVALSLMLGKARIRKEAEIPLATIPATIPSQELSSAPALPPPTVADVRDAVARIYGDTVQAQLPSSPSYVTGDFNGDDSQDLAVLVRPVPGKLGDLNDAVANWIVEDPELIFVPDPSKKVQKLPPVLPRSRVRAAEVLLAIVHGLGPQGWRDPAARQSYLLRNAAGGLMSVRRKEDVLALPAATADHVQIFGDLIQSEHVGHPTLLFWTGGHYAWYGKQVFSN